MSEFYLLFSFLVDLVYFQSLPPELSAEPAVKEILSQYGQSFKEILQFETAKNDSDTHVLFTEAITNIKLRHQVGAAVLWFVLE